MNLSTSEAKRNGENNMTNWMHGTNAEDLTELTPGYDEPGIWLTTSFQYASQYGDNIYHVEVSEGSQMVVEFNDDMEPLINGEVVDFEDNVSIAEYAEKEGFDSLYFPVGNFTEDSETLVVFDGDNVKIFD